MIDDVGERIGQRHQVVEHRNHARDRFQSIDVHVAMRHADQPRVETFTGCDDVVRMNIGQPCSQDFFSLFVFRRAAGGPPFSSPGRLPATRGILPTMKRQGNESSASAAYAAMTRAPISTNRRRANFM
ncbi:hypothetical protein [Burkholderia seminalis]|uniref:hypothetical protein n=1 Tax=Burkholderia seminalis TaxID=488731 RepID=UPI00264CE091|nr:hypothetical protein [Burkholderia seminalis]MDN7853678.1 hypothetical protein [Burkholderia seminalis]